MPVSSNATLVDILDRILDKGLVIAGDVRVTLANVELLTIRIRLLICSVDKAEQIGLNWWKYDPTLTAGTRPRLARPAPRRSIAGRLTARNGRTAGTANGRRRTMRNRKGG